MVADVAVPWVAAGCGSPMGCEDPMARRDLIGCGEPMGSTGCGDPMAGGGQIGRSASMG